MIYNFKCVNDYDHAALEHMKSLFSIGTNIKAHQVSSQSRTIGWDNMPQYCHK